MPNITRVTRSKEQAKASYDRLSPWYDLLAGDSEKKYREIGLAFLGVQPGETALEIGFGTGHAILSLARAAGPAGKVCGLDLSEGMLNVAGQRVQKAGLSERVELSCGDAASLPYPGGHFDAVFMGFTLELFDTSEIPLVLNECARVLRREGRLCVVAMSKIGKANLMTRLYDWAQRHIPAYVDCRPIYVQQALEQAGFQTAESLVLPMWGLPVEIVLARK